MHVPGVRQGAGRPGGKRSRTVQAHRGEGGGVCLWGRRLLSVRRRETAHRYRQEPSAEIPCAPGGRSHFRPGRGDGGGRHRLHPEHPGPDQAGGDPQAGREDAEPVRWDCGDEKRSDYGAGNLPGADGEETVFLLAVHGQQGDVRLALRKGDSQVCGLGGLPLCNPT